jgi:sporulation protein YlmC with PRC-barrel domain
MRRCAPLFASLASLAFLANAGAEGLYGHLHEPASLHLSEIIGMEMVTPEGRRLGRITDLYFDRASGEVHEVAVGAARYPVSALVSGDEPRQVVFEPPFAASAGASAFLPLSAGKSLTRASRELGPPEAVVVDLLQGRVRPAQ